MEPISRLEKRLVFAVALGVDTSTHLLRMLIASHSKAHTVHRKLGEEELFVAKWEKELPGPAAKGSKAHRPPKVHCKLGRLRPTSEPFRHRKTVKLQHFPFSGAPYSL